MTAREYPRVWVDGTGAGQLVSTPSEAGLTLCTEHLLIPADRVAYVIEVDDLPQVHRTTPEWADGPRWTAGRMVLPYDATPATLLADALDLLALHHHRITPAVAAAEAEVDAIANALAEADDTNDGHTPPSAYFDAARLAHAAGLRLPADGPVTS